MNFFKQLKEVSLRGKLLTGKQAIIGNYPNRELI